MQFSNEDEDGDFGLNNAARSRLSSLFQSESTTGDVNQALTFTAPKQPRKNEPKPESQNNVESLKLIHHAVVHAYKLKDGNYETQGKIGCAILGQHHSFNYKCLLYKGKQDQITSCRILPNFIFHVQPNNYVNFYDDKNENWSLNFGTESDYVSFCKQVALAKANSQGKSLNSLVIQDLLSGDGLSLETGDSAEVKYTGWLLSSYSFGQEFDSNMKTESTYRIKLGKSKTIKGWSEGLVGAKKGTKRLLVIPPHLAYGSSGVGNTIAPDSTLIFEIHVLKIKKSRENSHSPSPAKVAESASDKKPEVLPRQSIGSISQEDNIRMRGASISEQLSQSPRKDKAQLISRMAKMGTATLPFHGAIAAAVDTDSDNEEEVGNESPPVQSTTSRTASPKLASKPHSRHSSSSSAVETAIQAGNIQVSENDHFQNTVAPNQIPVYSQAAILPQQPYISATSSYPTFPSPLTAQFPITTPQYPMHGMMPAMAANMADSHLPLLVSETRTQHSELRMTLCKITDKVDSVISKVDDLRYQQGKPGLNQVPFMDSAIILQNIERIVQENSQFKKDIEIKSSQLNILNEKICDLLQRNQRFLEESNSMLEQKTDSLQTASAQSESRLLTLEKEKTKLLLEISDSISKQKTSEAELQKLQNEKNELEQKLLQYEKEMSEQASFLKESNELTAESESLVNSLRDEVKNVEQEKRLLTSKLMTLEEKCKNLEAKAATVTNGSSKGSDYQVELLTMQITEVVEEMKSLTYAKEEVDKELSEAKESQNSYKTKIQELETDLKNALELKQKFETYYEKTRWKIKERYESQIVELMEEVKRLQASENTGNSSNDFSNQIKKIMNSLYKQLQAKFDSSSSYTGKEVLDSSLHVIRGLTMQMLEMKTRTTSNISDQPNENSHQIEQMPPEESKHLLTCDASQGSTDNLVTDTKETIQENGELSNSDIEVITGSESIVDNNEISESQNVPTTTAVESTVTDSVNNDSGGNIEIKESTSLLNSENEKKDEEVDSHNDVKASSEIERHDSPVNSQPLSTNTSSEIPSAGTAKV